MHSLFSIDGRFPKLTLPPSFRSGDRYNIRGAGARLLFLPPYSPDFNPIENFFAKLKTLLRKAAA